MTGSRVAALLARARSAAPHAAAAFTLFFGAFCFATTLPPPPIRADVTGVRDGREQWEIDRWAAHWGVDEAEARRRITTVVQGVRAVRDVVRPPFAPFSWVTGVREDWTLFAMSTALLDGLELRARRRDGTWFVYYRAGTEADGLRHLIEASRARSYVFRASIAQRPVSRRRLCNALALRAFFNPDITALECAYVRSVAHVPGAAAPPPPERDRAVTIERPPPGARLKVGGGG